MLYPVKSVLKTVRKTPQSDSFVLSSSELRAEAGAVLFEEALLLKTKCVIALKCERPRQIAPEIVFML
jgi:hypothetical protein